MDLENKSEPTATVAVNSKKFRFIEWGQIDYQKSVALQLEMLEQVAGGAQERIVFCSHPPVVTVGRATKEGDVFDWAGDVVEIQRGGRATYHGPSQLVIYPILNLDRRGRDIHKYLRALEDALISTFQKWTIPADRRVGETGVWVGNKKLASLGIGIKKWVTYHGAAINIEHDATAFQGMNPCGYKSSTMTSLEALTGVKPDRAALIRDLKNALVTL